MSAPGTSGTSSKSSRSKKSKQEHPPYADMLKQSLTAMRSRGASRQALLKYMMKNFQLGQDEKAVNSRLKLALKSGTEKGLLMQSTGTGATGSFKLSKTQKVSKPATAKKPKASVAKKPKATIAKASTAKKTAKPKKVSLGTSAAKSKKLSLAKKSAAKAAAKSKAVAKKTSATKAKGVKVAKPKTTKAAAGKAKKPAGKK